MSGLYNDEDITWFEHYEGLTDIEPRKKLNNPHNEPTGHFTGRCSKCGSSDLWDDNLHYGCNSCGAFLA